MNARLVGVTLPLFLAAVSLRKLPWENSWEWMQDYLAREEALFAERIEMATGTVRRLARTIEAFKEDTGASPPVQPSRPFSRPN